MAYGNTTTSSPYINTVCRDTGIKGRSCDSIYSTECYNGPIQNACCRTCESYRTDIPGCQFGDRALQCDTRIQDRDCYKLDVRNDCCKTCKTIEDKYFSGCWYGDNATDCRHEHCPTYTLEKRQHCCFTCTSSETTNEYTTSRVVFTTSQPADRTDSTSLAGNEINYDWVLPVAAGLGGVLFLTIVIIAVVMYCRRRQRPSPISDEMYRDYKITKRSPMPEPRDTPDNPKKLDRQDTAGYAYIRPNEMDNVPSQDGKYSTPISSDRTNCPLPDVPTGEGVDKYGYLTPSHGDTITVDKYGYLLPSDEHAHAYTDLHDT